MAKTINETKDLIKSMNSATNSEQALKKRAAEILEKATKYNELIETTSEQDVFNEMSKEFGVDLSEFYDTIKGGQNG